LSASKGASPSVSTVNEAPVIAAWLVAENINTNIKVQSFSHCCVKSLAIFMGFFLLKSWGQIGFGLFIFGR
jgi:hypothetical protein